MSAPARLSITDALSMFAGQDATLVDQIGSGARKAKLLGENP